MYELWNIAFPFGSINLFSFSFCLFFVLFSLFVYLFLLCDNVVVSRFLVTKELTRSPSFINVLWLQLIVAHLRRFLLS